MQSEKLNANVVLVKLNGKDLYFDPGAAFTPFGMLTWSETGTPGLRLDKEGGSWIMTTLPPSSESRVERNAKLRLSDTGDLEGTLTITYTGLEAMYRRLDLRNSDEVARKNFLEDELKEQVPAAIEVELTNKPDWTSSETPLVAEFRLKVPGWVSGAGKRAVMPVGLFTQPKNACLSTLIAFNQSILNIPSKNWMMYPSSSLRAGKWPACRLPRIRTAILFPTR